MYFDKQPDNTARVPEFNDTRDRLPAPIYDEDPTFVTCYWRAWELAFRNFHVPASGSGFVSPFIDAAFNDNIFLWDTCFMTMFCNYGHPYVPGIGSLDNFYAKQHESGEICREISRKTGKDYELWVNADREPMFSRWGFDWEKGLHRTEVTYVDREPPSPPPVLTLDALNHPILAWAELESYRITGDKQRLELIWEPLVHYYAAMDKYLRQGNGLYITDGASMDNSPRNRFLEGGGTAVDVSSEMVLFARDLAKIAAIIGKKDAADHYTKQADELAARINRVMWDANSGFYYDRTLEGRRTPIKTVAAYWTLLAGVASPEQAAALAEHLRNPKTFGTLHRVPTMAADEEGFDGPTGCYWRGAVWAPTTMMVVRGLERYDRDELAREIAMNHLSSVVAVFRDTHTLWENYAPQMIKPGDPAKPDFVGWSGLAPITLLLEYAIGLKPDAPDNTLTWTIHSADRVGVERYWFGGATVSLVCEAPDAQGARKIQIRSDKPFTLKIHRAGKTRHFDIPGGQTVEAQLN